MAIQQKQLQRCADALACHIRELIGAEVTKYLKRIAELLMDPGTKLSWSMFSNNCQHLVNRLLGGKDFEYTFPRLPPNFGLQNRVGDDTSFRWPRYLISFGNHIEGLGISIIHPDSAFSQFFRSKSTALNVVEYLEAARQRTPKSCPKWISQLILSGNTEIDANSNPAAASDALWELPCDALSLLQFHLLLPAHKYFTASGQPLTDSRWIENRLQVLRLLDIFSSLTGAFGNALLSMFSRTPSLISQVTIPKSRIYGGAGAHDLILLLKVVPRLSVVYLIFRRKDKLDMLGKQAAYWRKKIERKLDKEFVKSFWGPRMGRLEHSGRSRQELAVQCVVRVLVVVFRYFQNMVTHTGMPGALFLAQTLARTIRYHDDNWVTIEAGPFMIAQQILRKTKNVRK